MRLNDLTVQLRDVREQLLALECAGEFRQSCVLRLMFELEQLDRTFTARRQREQAAPTLRDIVAAPARNHGAMHWSTSDTAAWSRAAA